MHFEDFKIGDRAVLGSHTFTAEEIITFARAHDPQDFHTGEAKAARTHFGGLIASGWHTAAIWMRLNIAYQRKMLAERAARDGAPVRLGPSPGFRDMKWSRPVRPGDTLTYGVETVEARRTASRPGWGIVTFRASAANQDGDEVMSFFGSVFVETRDDPGA